MSKNIEFTEDLFLKVVNYPIKTSQVLGYLPLHIKKCPKTQRFSLKFNYLSIPFMVTISQIFLALFFAALHSYYFKKLGRLQSTQSDGISMGIMTLIVFSSTLAHRVLGLFMARNTIRFWKSHINLWNKHFQSEATNSTIQDKLAKLLRFYQSFARIVFCSGLFYYLLALSSESVLRRLNLIKDGFISSSMGLDRENLINMSLILFSFISSTFFMFLHPLGILWVTVFPHLYCVNLEIIAEKVASIQNSKDFQFKVMKNNKSVIDQVTNVEPFLSLGDKMLLKPSFVCKEESKVISEVVEMYHATVKMVKEFNRVFSGKLILETLYSMFVCLFFTYFMLFWTLDGKYFPSAMNMFPLVMAFVEIYHLGNVGSCLSTKNAEVSEALHQFQLSRRPVYDETHLKVIS